MAKSTMEARVLRILKAQHKTPIGPGALAKKAGIRKNAKAEYLGLLDRLQEENRLMEKSGKLILAENLGLVGGKVVKVTGTFGFARPDGADKDVFVAGRKLAGALPGDSVLLKVTRGSGELPEGEVYKVTAEASQRFSAVLELLPDGAARVHPDHYVRFPLWVNPKKLMGAKDGDKVLCEIAARGARHSEHRARILHSYGSADSAAACCKAILGANGIPEEFPPEVLEQARAVAAGEGIHPKELANRLDLRQEPLFTIDGTDSKDLDDAVSLERRADGGWNLGVHIADVSHYVTHLTPLDKEAFARGTSVYYADSVVPMLPEELSNGICSLNPGEDRLAFSALLHLEESGKLAGFRFAKSVIRSRVKGVYGEVNAILNGTADEALLRKYEGLTGIIREMRDLAALLAERRWTRGGVNLESVESKILLDESGRAVDVVPRERGAAEGIIEEFMLTANEAAATFALEENLPFVFRVHENPAPDKVARLYDVVEQLGLKAYRPKGGVTAQHLAALLGKARGTPVDRVINTMVLRSMAKAKYSETCTGHFGLALHNYTHFTSPIRRYPDLTIHRILSAHLGGMKKMNLERRFNRFAAESALRSSERELAAMTAERDCEDCYKAEFMQVHLGEAFDGVITSVTAFGVYVQLPSTVEGLVPVSDFPEGEWQPENGLAFVEKRTGKKLRLGDPVRVQVAGANVSAGTVDFRMDNAP